MTLLPTDSVDRDVQLLSPSFHPALREHLAYSTTRVRGTSTLFISPKFLMQAEMNPSICHLVDSLPPFEHQLFEPMELVSHIVSSARHRASIRCN